MRTRADALSTSGGEQDADEATSPADVREVLLGTAADAALALRAWTDALGYLDREISSRDRRAAPPRLRAETRFKKWHPLRELGRVAEARAIVLDCREVFLAANDLAMLMASQDALPKLGDSAA